MDFDSQMRLKNYNDAVASSRLLISDYMIKQETQLSQRQCDAPRCWKFS